MPNIYYLIPDLFKAKIEPISFLKYAKRGKFKEYFQKFISPSHKPVGGIKVMYQHCLMLNELGFNASPVLMGKYKGNFFGYDLNYLTKKELENVLKDDDILVSTEFHPYDGLAFEKGVKVMFMQNWINLDRRFQAKDIGKTYEDLGYDHVITCGQYCSDMVNEKMGINAITITNGIDQQKFKPNENIRVNNRILALSRKNIDDLNSIIDKIGEFAHNIHIVDGLTQEELILEFQKADIFLATGYPEGLPLPPLEAMNCGCVVVGFTGGGANEYMINEKTALVAKDGDCDAASSLLLKLLNDTNLKEKIRKNGINTAQAYTLENTSSAINSFYTSIIANHPT